MISSFCPGTLPFSSVKSPRMVPVTSRSRKGFSARRRPPTLTQSLACMATQKSASASPITISRARARQDSRPQAPQSRPGSEKDLLSTSVANSATESAFRTPGNTPGPQDASASPLSNCDSSSSVPRTTIRGSQVSDLPPSTNTISASSRGNISCSCRVEFQSKVVILGPIPATLTHSCAKRDVSVPSRSSPWWVNLTAATLRPRSVNSRASSSTRVVLPDFLKPTTETALNIAPPSLTILSSSITQFNFPMRIAASPAPLQTEPDSRHASPIPFVKDRYFLCLKFRKLKAFLTSSARRARFTP